MFAQLKTKGSSNHYDKTLALQLNPRFLPMFKGSVSYNRFPLARYEEGSFDVVEKNALGAGITLDLFGVTFDYAYKTSDHPQYSHHHYLSVGYSI